jgi:HD-GYP domain-containing protein (c-di-GMP phosphodiesterase class II)
MGALEVFQRNHFSPDREWIGFLEMLAGQAAIAIDNATLFNDLQRSNLELHLAYDRTLEGWVRAMDLRLGEAQQHTQRVVDVAKQLGRAMGLGEDELVHLQRGALLHDIGNMAIPDSIIQKPDTLTPAEWEIVRRHPYYARELLGPITYLRPAIVIPYSHHEWWDGSGYPEGLRGLEIPLAARIFTVVDVWDAMRTWRPYRQAHTEEEARAYLLDGVGKQFDPGIVRKFLELLDADPVLAFQR